jgi:hypothetical protein
MRLLLAILISFSVSSFAWAGPSASPAVHFNDFEDLRLRPSYVTLHKACTQQSDFKLDYYYEAYAQGLSAGLEFLTLSKSGVTALMASQGVSPFLYGLLENPSTPLALYDCFQGDLSEQMAFVRNMLIADGAGKLVAISIVGVAVVGTSKIAGKAYSALASISPVLARRLLYATTLASSGFAIKHLMREQEVQDDTATPDIKNIFSKKLVDSADENLAKLQELAKDDALKPEERAEVEKEIRNWLFIKEKFKAS